MNAINTASFSRSNDDDNSVLESKYIIDYAERILFPSPAFWAVQEWLDHDPQLIAQFIIEKCVVAYLRRDTRALKAAVRQHKSLHMLVRFVRRKVLRWQPPTIRTQRDILEAFQYKCQTFVHELEEQRDYALYKDIDVPAVLARLRTVTDLLEAEMRDPTTYY